MAETVIQAPQLLAVLARAADAMIDLRDALNTFDAAIGDGDTGINVSMAGAALRDYVRDTPAPTDLGQYLANAGLAINHAAANTLGALLAAGLMRVGHEARGLSGLSARDLSRMALAMNDGVRERGKANLGDKTIVDALDPAAIAFAQSIAATRRCRWRVKPRLKPPGAGATRPRRCAARLGGRVRWPSRPKA